jgi:hypothetical protein
MIKTKCVESNSIYKNYCRQLKMSMFKINCSARFHSIGLDNIREGDLMFLAVSLFLICGKIHTFSNRSKRLSYISFGLWNLYI